MAIVIHGGEPQSGTVVSIVISLLSMSTLAVCLSRRVQGVKNWSKLPLVCWLVLLIYSDSILFVLSTGILSNGYGVSQSKEMCSRAILLCLGCYMTTKVMLYYFLVERAYIIRNPTKPRRKSRLYLFNSFGMLIPYCVVIILNFYFRFATFGEDHTCRIGMKKISIIPLISFDILVNVYLTSLFLFPLCTLYSYKNNPSSQTRSIAIRTFIGSCFTLTSSVVNLTIITVLNGEPGWICLMACNVDILFSVIVLHWITSQDNASTMTPTPFLPTAAPRSPNRHLVARTDPDYHYELANVTTFVTVGDEDVQEVKVPPNAITVSRDTVRAVDSVALEKQSWSSESALRPSLEKEVSESV